MTTDVEPPEGAADPPAPDEAAPDLQASEGAGAAGGAVVETPAAAPAASDPTRDRREQVRTRVLLPLLLPIASIFVIGFYVLNLSRVFLSGKGAPAVVVATILTVAILGGAAYISASPGLRTSSLVLTVSLLLVIVMSAGLVSLGASEEKKEAANGPKPPAGPPVNTLEVDALASLSFQAKEFTVPAGINNIVYVDKGGTHTLVFGEPQLSYFELQVPGGPTEGKVELQAGNDYVIYCTIPGHRAAGMQATVKVGPAPAGAPVAGATTTTAAKA